MGWLLLGGVAQLVECLPSSHKFWGSSLAPRKPALVFSSYKWNMTSKPFVESACCLPPEDASVYFYVY